MNNVRNLNEGLNVLNKPEKQLTVTELETEKNIAANKAITDMMFPNESWINIDNIKLDYKKMPADVTGILVAESNLPKNKQEEEDFLKEVKSAIILQKHGACVTLIPRIRRKDGKGFQAGPDAIVNGVLYEFKEVTGGISKIGDRFKDSRKQGNNVYIRVENLSLTKSKVVRYLARYISMPTYQGGFEGNIIFTFGADNGEKIYFFKIKDLKK